MLILCLLTAGAAPATAPEGRVGREQLQQWLADLSHDDPQARENARVSLMGISRDELQTFRDVVEKAQPLLPAQAVALREIVLQAYAAGEPYQQDRSQGFLGVELRTTQLPGLRPEGVQPSGVLIVSRLLGFAGYRWMQDGDIVLGVLDRLNARTGDFTDLSTLIRGIPAGTRIQLEVYRRGRILQVPITLDARPADLARFQNLDTLRAVRFRRAYEYWRDQFAPLVEQGVL